MSTVQSNRQKKGQQKRSAGDEEEIATSFPGPSLSRSSEKREHWEASWKEYCNYSINRPGRLLNFWTLRVGAYSRWSLIRGWALIKFSAFSASVVCLFCNKTINGNDKTRRCDKASSCKIQSTLALRTPRYNGHPDKTDSKRRES